MAKVEDPGNEISLHVQQWHTMLTEGDSSLHHRRKRLVTKWLYGREWSVAAFGVRWKGILTDVTPHGCGVNHPSFTLRVKDGCIPDTWAEITAPFEHFWPVAPGVSGP